MAGELIRPGVEVIQTFEAPAPSFVRPTLVPCPVGPAFEVINILTSESALNAKAKYGAYAQIGKTITQSAFPDHRSNIDELNILEETIRPFMVASGSINELLMDPGESFLSTSHGAAKAAIRSKVFNNGGLAVGGKVLVLALDQPVRLDRTADITIVFTGGSLTAQQTADQINTAVGQTVATVINPGTVNDRVQIASPSFGAKSSVTVRAGGSANSVLEIGYDTVGVTSNYEQRIEGAGWRGQDDNDNDTLTPWVEFYQGDYLANGVAVAFLANQTGMLNVESPSTFVAAKASAITFGDAGTIPLKVGDFVYCDGIKLKSGEVMKVEAARFKVGTINTARSVADSNGRYTTKVYDVAEVDTLFADSPLAPKYVYFKATNLDPDELAPTAASLTGSIEGVAATSAVITGVGAPAGPFNLAGLKLHHVVMVDGVETEGNFTFTGTYNTMADVAAAVVIAGVTASNASGQLRLTTTKTGRLQAVTLKADGTANASLGFSITVDTSDTGSDVEFVDIPAVLTTSGQVGSTLAGLASTTLKIEVSTDGGVTWVVRSHTFGVSAPANLAALVTELNGDGVFSNGLISAADGTELKITSTLTGQLASLRVFNDATNTAVDPTAGNNKITLTKGQSDLGEEELNGQSLSFLFDSNPHLYTVVFSNNSLDLAIAEINELVGATVAEKAGSNTRQIKILSTLKGKASKVSVSSGQAQKAFGLSLTAATGTGRPYPDAYLDDTNNLVVGSQILRDLVTGYPLDFALNTSDLYVQFKALRKDVSAVAQVAGVLRIADQETLASVLDPITDDNPLALAVFLTMINAPTYEVKCLGVDEISAAAPEGTETAYARALALLEAEEVYALVPLSQNEVVHGMFHTHATVMSQPEQGGERIALINKVMPTRKNPVIALSGTKANSTSTANQMQLDANPAAGLLSAGVDPTATIPVADGVYMEFEVDGALVRYNVKSVSGPLVNFRNELTSAENSDGFYTTGEFNETVVNASYALKVRGESLVIPGSSPERLDYGTMAEVIAEANASFANRRVFSVFPDTIKTTVAGIEKSLPAYYGAACVAGMIASQPPQQPFTNFPHTGLTGVVGTEKFSRKQLNVIAGGGTYILIQDVQGGAVSCRHQLSTDLTSIETRELSITKVVDFCAKFLRGGVKKFIGTQVINEQLLDTIGTTIQGMLTFLVDLGVLNGANMNNLIQDTSQPDTILVDVTLEVPFPCNYIKLTLVV